MLRAKSRSRSPEAPWGWRGARGDRSEVGGRPELLHVRACPAGWKGDRKQMGLGVRFPSALKKGLKLDGPKPGREWERGRGHGGVAEPQETNG